LVDHDVVARIDLNGLPPGVVLARSNVAAKKGASPMVAWTKVRLGMRSTAPVTFNFSRKVSTGCGVNLAFAQAAFTGSMKLLATRIGFTPG
jgi:hypothetical protein